MPEGARVALQAHLSQSVAGRPRVVDAQTAWPEGRETGVVSANVSNGEVFLRYDGVTDRPAPVFRLVWSGEGPRERRLPTGNYTILGHRLVRGDWHVSTTGGAERVRVQADRPLRLEVDAAIAFTWRVVPKRGKGPQQVGLQAGLQSGGRGLTLYHGGKRVPLVWRFEGADGAVLTHGTLRYG